MSRSGKTGKETDCKAKAENLPSLKGGYILKKPRMLGKKVFGVFFPKGCWSKLLFRKQNANSNHLRGKRHFSSSNCLAPVHCYANGTITSFPFVTGKRS